MKKKFIKHLSLLAAIFMIFTSVFPLSVNAEEITNDTPAKEFNGEGELKEKKSDDISGETNSESRSNDLDVTEDLVDPDEENESEEHDTGSDSSEKDSETDESGSDVEEKESISEEDSGELNEPDSKKDSNESNREDEEAGEKSNDKSDEAENDLEKNEQEEQEEQEKQEEPKDNVSKSSLSYQESNTSLLGHIRSSNVKVYKDQTLKEYFTAGKEYINQVYYIKKQADIGGELYYLISDSPSSVNDVVGWAKAKDLSIHHHKGFDKNKKTFIFKGTGKTYTKAWGGSKDVVLNDLDPHKGGTFQVHLTEKVGNNTWYRGTINGQRMWVHSSYVREIDKATISNTSKLAHIRRGNVKIYENLNLTEHKTAGKDYTNAVYYIKSQAKIGKQNYYLLSTSPSKNKNLVGWVKSEDLSIHVHNGTDKTPKEFYFTGKGKAYSKAWGGSKDLVYDDLSKLKSQSFKVNLTERVGSNVWYRGTIEGETAWIHSSYLTTKKESKTSLLAHLRYDTKIYKELGKEDTKLQTNEYTHAVYYIKRQVEMNDEIYYMLSTSPSATKGVIGWAKAKEINVHTHNGTDKTPKIFYFNGKGKAYSKAWGGSKDLVYEDMSQYKDSVFNVNLTEKVGGNVWYRGVLEGKTIWVHGSYVNQNVSINYNLTLDEAADLQMKSNPQTDKPYGYVSKQHIDNGKVTASALNVRTGPSTSGSKILGTLNKNTPVKVISEPVKGWYQIEYKSSAWVNAAKKDVMYYLNPKNFLEDEKQRFQFLDLSKNSNSSVATLNSALKGYGILEGQGQAFIDAGKEHGLNDIYLISHALLETGNGTSELAKGVKVGKNASGKPTLVTKGNQSKLKDIKIVYNMYGIQAYDNCALECGAKHAYTKKWFTPELAIIGGAEFIGKSYIKQGQNTLYKMRWNPLSMSENGVASHQYATDIGWASKQINTMYNLYKKFGINAPNLEVPIYK